MARRSIALSYAVCFLSANCRLDPSEHRLEHLPLPGSFVSLALMMGIFIANYVIGV